MYGLVWLAKYYKSSVNKKPLSKTAIFEDLYLQLLSEIAAAENEILNPEQTTTITSDEFEFELKFKKKKPKLKLVLNED